MKMNLLEIVQDIANDLETDYISSITDTVEASQIAQIVKTTYFELMANRRWPHLKKTIQLSNAAISAPVQFDLPDTVVEVEAFFYDKARVGETRKRYEALLYVEPELFLYKTNQRSSDQPNIDVIQALGGEIDLLIRNDKVPEYYTTFDDRFIICDSYVAADVGGRLMGDKTQVIVYESPEWIHEDNFIPFIPVDVFPLLIAEAKSTASMVIKQQPNEKAEQKSVRQNRWLSRKAWRIAGGVQYPNYGRKKHFSGHRKNPLFNKDFKI